MRFVVYLRVSTDQQADTGQGLEIQEQACRSWLRSHRHRLAGVFTDAGRSGALDVGDRPGLTAAAGMLADDRADGILVYRLDRLGVSYRSIAVELSRRGFPSRAPSGQWRPGTIHEILSRAEMRQQARAIASPSPEIVEVSA
jgi:hypothetical protein